jgi:hypothetical protein
MGSLGDKRRSTRLVGLDAAIFIYHFEDHPRYQVLCTEIFGAMEAGANQAVTSTVTLGEVYVQPLAKGSQELASCYPQYLRGGLP